jgi:5-methylcytosine-specific restriction endonuclease McrA
VTVDRRHPSPSLRFKVFERDGFTCVYCGRKAPEVRLSPDHKIPYCRGGPTTLDNLVTSCKECNTGKSGRLLEAIQ